MRWISLGLAVEEVHLGLQTGKRAGAGVQQGVEALLTVLPLQMHMGGHGEGSQKGPDSARHGGGWFHADAWHAYADSVNLGYTLGSVQSHWSQVQGRASSLAHHHMPGD